MLNPSADPNSRYAADHVADLWPASASQAARILASIYTLRMTLESRTLSPLRSVKMQAELKTLEGLYAGTLSEIQDAFGVEAADALSATLYASVHSQ